MRGMVLRAASHAPSSGTYALRMDEAMSGWPDQARRPSERVLGWILGLLGVVVAIGVARQLDDPTVAAAGLTGAAVLVASMVGGTVAGMGTAVAAGALAWWWLTPEHPAADGFELFLAGFGILIALGVGATLQLRFFARVRSDWLDRLDQLTEELDAARESDDLTAQVEDAVRRATGARSATVRTADPGVDPSARGDLDGRTLVTSRTSPPVVLELELPAEPPEALRGDHATFLRSVADQCAHALQRAELEHAEQRATAAFALLARASRDLSASLDVDDVLATVESLVVPDLADECTVRVRPRLSQPGGHRRERDHASALEGGSTIPLRAHGELIAELDLRRGARQLTADELEAATLLAEPVGRALDHALLYAEQVQTSSRLEHSLLPPALLPIEHLDVATRYLAAAEGHAAGGDFYDVLSIPNGDVVLVVGDVQGKGIDAATLTSAARHTLRAAALDGAGPAQMLARLNTALLYGAAERAEADPNEVSVRFVTVSVVALRPTPQGFRATIASGGHPPLLLIPARGAPQQVVVDGVVLGVFADGHFAEEVRDLALADVIVLYSDGVTEQRAQPDLFDEAQLGRLVRNMNTTRQVDSERAARLILDTVVGLNPREVRDDIALVVARVTGPR
jgi:serine phosphatase RsbU (regulator of sigma subunit)